MTNHQDGPEVSAADNLGPHLLGRLPSPPDARDFPAEALLRQTAADPLVVAMNQLQASHASVATKIWAALATQRILAASPNPPAPPAPTPPAPQPTPTADKVWQDPDAVLDQGRQGTCVGHGCAQWGNTDPVEDHFTHTDALHIYYEATVIDGSPDDPFKPGGGQQGATVRSGMQALKNRGRTAAYARISSLASIKEWLQTKGPVVFGTDWTNDMFNPDSQGYVKPTGGVAGGHCWCGVGDLESETAMYCLNSWGAGWALKGYFKIAYPDLEQLVFSMGGEAWGAVELPTS